MVCSNKGKVLRLLDSQRRSSLGLRYLRKTLIFADVVTWEAERRGLGKAETQISEGP